MFTMFKSKKDDSQDFIECKENLRNLQAELDEKISNCENFKIDILKKTNELFHSLTKIEYIKEMIQKVEKQTEMITNITSSSEEMSTSIEDISTYVQNSFNSTNEGIESSKESVEKINNSFKLFENILAKTAVVQDNMNSVNLETKEIDKMIEIIKSVADQTNLLALNASIEAARAGEQGRGFVVVAEEIKKLAENTTKQVKNIQNTVSSLNEKVKISTNNLNNVMESFDEAKVKMTDSVKSINVITESLECVGKNFMEISANTEEQTATSQEISSNLMVINDEALYLREEINKTGKMVFEVTNLIDEIRLDGYNSLQIKDFKTHVNTMISDHLLWTCRVRNMILGYVKLDETQVQNFNICRLGKWMNTIEKEDPRLNNIIKDIKKPHQELHEIAKLSIIAYKNNKLNEAENLLEKMNNASGKVVSLLEKMLDI